MKKINSSINFSIKLKCIFYLNLSFSIFCSSQNNLDYSRFVRDAELSICQQNYIIAIEKYDSAFKIDFNHYAKDIHNSIVCNILSSKIESAINLSSKLIKIGVDSSYFLNNDVFKPMISSELWNKQIIQKKVFTENYLKEIDTALRRELIKRYLKDQDASNSKRNEYIFENTIWLKEMIARNRFPSESRVGVFIENNKLKNNLHEIMLIHYSQKLKKDKSDALKSDTLKLASLLYELIPKGELNPAFFATLNVIGTAYNLLPTDMEYFIVVGDSVFVRNISNDDKNKIDSKRTLIGLHKYEDYLNIIKFNMFDKRFSLYYGNVIGFYPEFMEETFKGSAYKNIGNKKDILNMK